MLLPATSIISLLYVMKDGASVIVGNEGILRCSWRETTPSRAVAKALDTASG
jgi:hypothetical protein